MSDKTVGELLDHYDIKEAEDYYVSVFDEDWRRISAALRAAVAWLKEYDMACEIGTSRQAFISAEAREAFRRALGEKP